MLKKMGAKININENVEIAEDDLTDFGIKEEVWNVITVTGRTSLRGANHRVMPDRIEFGTYTIAAAMNNGRCLEITLNKCIYKLNFVYTGFLQF
jgi:UDP-N-acetylglucosamine enolpyruvyl transferase